MSLSLPMRERGLKQSDPFAKWIAWVAPHAGAWIETHRIPVKSSVIRTVAPHAGAWIETRLH